MTFLSGILVYLAAINVITYRAFALDKQFAIANRGIPRDRNHAPQRAQRISEAHLFFLATIGGWAGAKYAQHKLRHKSHKQPFGKQLNDIGILHGAAFATVATIGAVLWLASPLPATSVRAKAAVPKLQRVIAPPHLSLRPPAARPVMW